MNDLLPQKVVVIDDSAETERLLQLLKENRFGVSQFSDLAAAARHCMANRPDVVLFEPQSAADRGSAFVRQLRTQYSDAPLPIMVITQEADLEKRLELLGMGIDDLLLKPYYPEEAVARVQMLVQENKLQAVTPKPSPQGFSGSLKEMNLIDLIQTMEMGAKSGIIYLHRGDKEGQVHIQSGKIVDAVVEDYQGVERAFLHMLTWTDGAFSVVVREIPGNRTAPANMQRLFEEGARIIEQWRKLTGELPALQTQLLQVEGGDSVRMSQEERTMLRQFHDSATILQAIDRSEFDDFNSLNIIKSLLAKGLLIKSEQRVTDERPQPIKTMLSPNIRAAKNKYSHIFSLFRRKRHHERGADAKGGAVGRESAGYFEEKIVNRTTLTKAELLLIRQRFSS